MTDLNERLEAARANVARLEREVAQTACAESGHRWTFTGGMNCGCIGRWCSLPVYSCAKCGDCDYGDNLEAQEIRWKCATAFADDDHATPQEQEKPK